MKSINVSIKRESELCNSPSFQESNDKGLGISNKRKRAYVNDNFLTLILLILVDYLYTNGSTSEITQPVLDQNQENTQNLDSFKYLVKVFIGHRSYGLLFKVCEVIKKDLFSSKYALFIKRF